MEINNELGFQYLNTAFTGTNSIPVSSSNPEQQSLLDEFLLPQDLGVASTLESKELKSYFQ
jgi:hypothetical protein